MNEEYSAKTLLRIAKRYNNAKRTYLLVNTLQAKHIPVSPLKALDMMNAFGAIIKSKYGQGGLVIGFAETATAIGAAVAVLCGCDYIHTTREREEGEPFLDFSEEHSHAVEQKLLKRDIAKYIDNADKLIFVDDEFTTGKTLINIIDKLIKEFPTAAKKRIIAASVIDRISAENEARLAEKGIECVSLLKLPFSDYSSEVESVSATAPKIAAELPECAADVKIINTPRPLPDPRLGVEASEYEKTLKNISEGLLDELAKELNSAEKILVLGTEECMYPAIIFGAEIERNYPLKSVKSHSTTRSPIAVSEKEDYPIFGGYGLSGFYDKHRATFIYNPEYYDVAVIVTDSESDVESALKDIIKIFGSCGTKRFVLVKG
ncbi:MAG: phosphoribosyltransferase family protein [Clostridia bacterium]|nr:phosphoribosyltransferase family protein [Clostridia bacterium]